MTDGSPLTDWIGRRTEDEDTLDARPARALAAALGRDGSIGRVGDPLPILWHWLYFPSLTPPSSLGEDGHPRRGLHLPPAPGRRMFAGSRISAARPLRIGEVARRTMTVLDVASKAGRSGPLVLVTVGTRVETDGGGALDERQTIVYTTAAPAPTAAEPAPLPAAPWTAVVEPDPVLLFRYSAVTSNAHRIHYDAGYARDVEGYPDLVVQGPLVATLLLQLASDHGERAPTGFEFRILRPMFVHLPVTLLGTPDGSGAQLSSHGPDGHPTVRASASW